MLVKFISFVITVFGTKRYKPLLFTCAALIISFTGISAVAAFSPNQVTPVASTTAAEEQQGSHKDALNQQTPRKQTPRDDTTVQPGAQTATPTPPTTSGTSPSSSPTQQNASAAEIVLSANTVTIDKNSTSDAIKAALTDNTTAEWSVAFNENVPGAQISLETPQNTNIASFTLKTGSSTPAGTYTITIQAKDSARNTVRAKTTLTVVVTE